MFLSPYRNLKEINVSGGMIVADFESGAGYYTFSASDLVGSSGRVFSLGHKEDLLHKIKNEAKRGHIDNIEIIKANLEAEKGSGLKEGLVDLVIIANSLFSFDKKDQVAKEAFRILKKGGRVLVVEWVDSSAGLGPHRDHLIKEIDAKKIFEDSGFSFMNDINAGSHHYGFLLKKI